MSQGCFTQRLNQHSTAYRENRDSYLVTALTVHWTANQDPHKVHVPALHMLPGCTTENTGYDTSVNSIIQCINKAFHVYVSTMLSS